MRHGLFAAAALAACVALAATSSVALPSTGSSIEADSALAWVRTGGPIGGMGYDIRVDPADTGRMYVTDALSGVFSSSDGGRTWSPSSSGITARTGETGDLIPVFCLTIDQNQPNRIWAGTQAVRGVYRSDDRGAHWTEKVQGIAEGEGITFRGFTVDPRNSNTVYAAAEISSFVWAGAPRTGREFDLVKGVVYKTTDGGDHWQAVWRGDNLARYTWLDPRNPDVVYVSTGIFDREAANSDSQAGRPGGVGVIKSSDGGRTWRQIVRGLGSLYVGSLFMNPVRPDTILAGAGNNAYPSGGGVYLTTDGGASWRQTLRGDVITAVEFALSRPSVAYAGSESAIYRSSTGGVTWQRVTTGASWGPPGVRAGFPIDFQVDPQNPDRLFANNYGGGNFFSADGGRTWTNASSGYTGAQVRALAGDSRQPGRVYAAGRSGVFHSVDGGADWAGLCRAPANEGGFNALAIDPVGGSHFLAGDNSGGNLFASYDGGLSWRVVARVPWGLGWRSVAFAPSDSRFAYAGVGGFVTAGAFDNRIPGGGVFSSTDGGQTWRRPAGPHSDAHVAALAVDPVQPTRVFAATIDSGLLKSTDGGHEWVRLGTGLPDTLPAQSVAVDPADERVVLVGFEGGGVYRSEDGGASWKPSSVGLVPEASASAIVFSAADHSVVYVADRRSGVYRSTDAGRTWSPLNEALSCRSVYALDLTADGSHLYAATDGGGVYRLDLSSSPPAKYQVPPPASLSRPQPSRITMPHSAPLAVSGSVRPGHATAGTLTCEKLIGGRWTKAGAYARTWISSVGGAFRVSYRLPAGKYRFRSSHGSSASTSCHLRGLSAYSQTVTVK